MAALAGEMRKLREKFVALAEESVDEQARFFANRFVFALGEDFSKVFDLATAFKAAVEADSSSKDNKLSPAGAADFLQHQGQTRTAQQRKAELADVDINQDGMISFIEMMMLMFKVMILKGYYARHEKEPDVDLSSNGVGLTGVGDQLLQELFDVPQGLDKDLEAMMREFSVEHAKRQEKIKALEAKVAKGGVQGLAAKNELEQLRNEDKTEMNAVEARIAAAVKKAVAKSKKELASREAAKEEQAKAKAAAGRSKLAEKAAMFGKRVSQRLSLGRK